MPPRDLSRSLQRTVAHLNPPPHRGGKFGRSSIPTHFRPNPPFVQVKDRIPFWHVAPGDRVMMVRGGEDVKGKVGIIDRVDRESNRVYLKEPEFAAKKRQFSEYPGQQLEPTFSAGEAGGTYIQPRAFHVSNVRLQVRDGDQEYTSTRVRKTKVTWDRRLRRFSWKRYALVPALSGKVGDEDAGWRELPWPKEDVPTSTPGPLDSVSTITTRSSWVPSLSALSLSPVLPSPRSPAQPVPVTAGAPEELQISQLDLGGAYWSRAKRTERFNQEKEEAKKYGKGVMKAKALVKAVQRMQDEVLL